MEFDEILLGMSFLKHLKMNQQGKKTHFEYSLAITE
jgi:predicted aspartyl protease